MSARLACGVSWLALLMASSFLVGGCWETPSRGWYDGGADGGDGCDAGCCDGSSCVPMDSGTRPRELECDDAIDNDEDDLQDCADLDCASHPSCCADGTPLFHEDWGGQDILWDHLPRSSPTPSPARQVEGEGESQVTMLTGWEDTTPHALVRSCVPLALGAELTFDVVATARDSVCDAPWHTPCERHAAVVLSTVRDTAPGQPLLDDLAIRVHGHADVFTGNPSVIHQAMLRITQAGVELGRALIDPGVRYRARLVVTPSSEGSLASLRADLELRRADDLEADPVAVLSVPFVIAQEQLVRGTTDCMEVGGLYAAVEMVGDGARLGPIGARSLACVNPSQFQTSPMGTTTLTSDSLGVPGRYGGAHIGSPTLGSSFNNVSDLSPRWDLFFEATNDAPELALIAPVGYAIAHARTATFGATPADWTTSATPRLGGDPPSCLVGGACSEPSVRDPFLLLRRGSQDVLQDFDLAFAAAAPTGGHTLRLEQEVMFSPNEPLDGPGVLLLEPDAECMDLRDPALVPVLGGSEGYWLFYTCVPSSGLSEIRAARLENDFMRRGGTIARRMVTPSDVGALAAGGVFGAEPIVRSNASGLTLQVWAVARDVEGNTSLVLLSGQVSAVYDTDGGTPRAPTLEALPMLSPYLANPVLRSDDAALGGCAGLCRITGVAVSETAGRHDELRFMVARRVVMNADDVFSELVPLTQTWRAP